MLHKTEKLLFGSSFSLSPGNHKEAPCLIVCLAKIGIPSLRPCIFTCISAFDHSELHSDALPGSLRLVVVQSTFHVVQSPACGENHLDESTQRLEGKQQVKCASQTGNLTHACLHQAERLAEEYAKHAQAIEAELKKDAAASHLPSIDDFDSYAKQRGQKFSSKVREEKLARRKER